MPENFRGEKSTGDPQMDGLVLLPYVDAFDEQPDVLEGHLVDRVALARPGELVVLEALLPEAEARRVPVDHLEHAPGLPAEDEVAPVEGPVGPDILHDRRKAVDLLPHVGESEPHEDPLVLVQFHAVSSVPWSVRRKRQGLNMGGN